jgi:hypothetical protein
MEMKETITMAIVRMMMVRSNPCSYRLYYTTLTVSVIRKELHWSGVVCGTQRSNISGILQVSRQRMEELKAQGRKGEEHQGKVSGLSQYCRYF